MKQIRLSNGMFTQVDDEDYDRLMEFNWQCQRNGHLYYPIRTIRLETDKVTSRHMHRDILDVPRELRIDHIDGNGLNNQKSNLRVCTHKQNLWNRRKTPGKLSQYMGVSRLKLKSGYLWTAQIRINDRCCYIGSFKTEQDAALAWNEVAKQTRGEFARLNKVNGRTQ